KQSSLLNQKPVYQIRNVIDARLFKPFNKDVARNILNIDNTKKIIAFGAGSLSSTYKERNYLKDALEILYNDSMVEDIMVIVFGNGDNEQIKKDIKYPIKFMGRLKDDVSTAIIYNASNVFIAPSVADN